MLDENISKDVDKAKIKAKPKTDLEVKVKAAMKRRLVELASNVGVVCSIDYPSSSEYGMSGRPDAYIDFGPLHFKIEVKRLDGELSPPQVAWHSHYKIHHELKGGPKLYVLYGKEGLDDLIQRIIIDHAEFFNDKVSS